MLREPTAEDAWLREWHLPAGWAPLIPRGPIERALILVRDAVSVSTGCDRARRVLAEHLGLDPSGGIILTKQCPRGAKRWAWILEDWNGERAELDPLSNEVDSAKFLAGYGAARGLWRGDAAQRGGGVSRLISC